MQLLTHKDGTGTTYQATATLTMASTNVILYAKWTGNPTFTVTYNGNGSTGGNVPLDAGKYESGATATVIGNTGNLVKTGYAFVGWNTVADGSGASYQAADTFTIGTTNVTLYAMWNITYTVTFTAGSNGSIRYFGTDNYYRRRLFTSNSCS